MVKRILGSHPYLYPMPMVLIGATIDGRVNFMPAAFVGIVNMKPAMIGCGLSPKHYTCKGIEKTKEFSVNVPSETLMEITDYCGLTSGDKSNKADLFHIFYGKLTHSPLIEECSVNIECHLSQCIPLGADTLYLGEILEIHCDESVLTDDDPDVTKIRPFVFSFPDKGYYRLGDRIGTGWYSGRNYKKT